MLANVLFLPASSYVFSTPSRITKGFRGRKKARFFPVLSSGKKAQTGRQHVFRLVIYVYIGGKPYRKEVSRKN
ncbi:hypothetical protein F5B19DRAFT_147256 [Rostrohypoxylon terebratum]|nr:hypothetical protein F5B19DRAFT_147256 [Rostrohypoxylon terebratum]